MLRSANPLMKVLKWSKLQRISPAQGVGSNGHCVGSMSIGTQFMHGAHFWLSETSWLSESGVLTKRDMQNMQRGGARGLELRTADVGYGCYCLDRCICEDTEFSFVSVHTGYISTGAILVPGFGTQPYRTAVGTNTLVQAVPAGPLQHAPSRTSSP